MPAQPAHFMRQAVLVGPKAFDIRLVPVPTPGYGDVLVKVTACGVCASELHDWHSGGEGELQLGHEVVGTVCSVGAGVRSLRAGMRVTGLFSGGFADYALTSEDCVVAIDDGIEDADALGEPISCAVSGMLRTRIELGDTISIVGLGFMGLLVLQLAILKGAARIVAIDHRAEALEQAAALGATICLRPDQVNSSFVMEDWGDLGKGMGSNVVIEASGSQSGITLAGRLTREHGILSIVGYHQGAPRTIDMHLWNWKAIEVVNAHERRKGHQMEAMSRGLSLLTSRQLRVAPLVTHRYGLEALGEAFHALAAKPSGFIKAIMLPG